MRSSVEQLAHGYLVWIPGVPSDNHHMVKPELYEKCKPTEMDLLAYFIIYGKHMKVPSTITFWPWGN